MKKIFIYFLLLSSLCLSHSYKSLAQDYAVNHSDMPNDDLSDAPSFVIKTNPLAALGGPFWVLGVIPITGEYKILFEAATANRQSAQIGVSYLAPSTLINLEKLGNTNGINFGIDISGFRVQAMYKFFLTSDNPAPEGMYLAPHLSYAGVKIVDKADITDYISGTKINYNALLGYQLISAGGFALDIFTGLGFKSKDWNYSKDTSSVFNDVFDTKNTTNVTFGLSFGYAF